MKKILLFTSIILLSFSVDVYAQHPTNPQSTNITMTTAELSWDASPCSGLVFFRYREAGVSTWTVVGSPTPGVSTPYILSGLLPATSYEWAVKCAGQSGWGSTQVFVTANAPFISSTFISDSIACFGGTASITVDIGQANAIPSSSSIQVLVGYYPTWSTTYLFKLVSIPVSSTTSSVELDQIPPGEYIVRIVDSIPYYTSNSNGSGTSTLGMLDEYSAIITVVQPDSLLATTNPIADNLCYGDCIAAEDLNITGGTSPYTFTVNAGAPQTLANGISGYSFVGLCADEYDLIVTDKNGCSVLNGTVHNGDTLTSFTISEPSEIIGNGFVSSDYNGYNISCNGLSDAEITASTINNHIVQTSGNTFTPDILNINLGDTVTFINTGGSHNVNGSQSTFPSNPESFGNSVGSGWTFTHVFTLPGIYDYQCDPHVSVGMTGVINVSSNGPGTSPIEYSLDGTNFFSNPVFSALSAGNYTVTYKDFNNCIDTQSLTVNEPPALSGVVSNLQNVDCFGDSTGEIDFSLDLTEIGTPGYQYSIDNGLNYQVSNVFSGLPSGTYDLMIEDINNCQFSDTISVTQSDKIIYSILLSDYNGNQISCLGADDGMIKFMSVSGGVDSLGLYNYSIDDGIHFDTTSKYLPLIAGLYDIQIKDSLGCIVDTVISLSDPGEFDMPYTINNAVLCPEACNGEIEINPSNGVGSILYNINAGVQQNSPVFSGLCGVITNSGGYSISAVDQNGCVDTIIISLSEPTAFVYSTDSILEYCSQSDGEASINITSGGTGSYNYEWNTFPPQFSANATNIVAGNYIVTVTDGNNCMFTEDVTVLGDIGFTVSFTTISPCLGDSSGSATVSATGTAPYSYQWSDINGVIAGETSTILDSMPIGTYSVVVTDATLCSITGVIDILPPSNSITIDSVLVESNSCFGINDGEITIYASGGQGPYAYSNNNGFSVQYNNNSFVGLTPATYQIQAIDANNCFDNTTVDVVSPLLLEIDSTVFTHVNCFGADDGAIQGIQVIGGTAPFEFSIDGGPTQSYMLFSGLDPGQHTIEVTDANNCIGQDYIIIEEPTALQVSIQPSNWNNYQIQCYNDSSGYIDIQASGGTYPYSIDTIIFSNNTTVNGIWAGNHTFMVEDINGCQYTETIMFNEPSPIMHEFVETHVTCEAWNNGAVTDSVYGGVGSATTYSYLWDSGETTYSLDNLSAGTYIITVTDENGCEDTESVEINADDALQANPSGQSNVSCFAADDGELSVTVSGGVPFTGTTPYTYLWNDSQAQNSSTASALTVDSIALEEEYYCAVADASGCLDTVFFTLTQPEELDVDIEIVKPISCTGEEDGELKAITTNALNPTSYQWSNAENTAAIDDLGYGIYKVTVEDANGCRDTFEIYLDEPTQVEVSIEAFNVNCTGDDDGFIQTLASGGTSFEYEYSYSLYLEGSFEEEITHIAGTIAQDSLEFLSLDPGTYYVIAKDRNGCEATSLSVEITEPFDDVSITVDVVHETCNYEDGIIQIYAEGGSQDFEYFIDGDQIDNNISDAEIMPGWHNVTVIDSRGCEDDDIVEILAYQPIFLPDTVASLDIEICLGASIDIDVDERPNLTYIWDDGVSGGDRVIKPEGMFPYGDEQEIEYTVTVIDSDGCEQENTVTVTFESIDPMIESDPEVDYGDHPVVLAGEEIELSSDNNDGEEYIWSWSNDTITNSDGEITVEGLSSSDWYYLHIEDEDGCIGYDSIYVVVGVKAYEYITPNDDDKNDEWHPLDIESYPDAYLQVFNRWGGLVWSSQGGEDYEAWDGTNKGKDLPAGTYYYIIDLDTGDAPQTGPITILK